MDTPETATVTQAEISRPIEPESAEIRKARIKKALKTKVRNVIYLPPHKDQGITPPFVESEEPAAQVEIEPSTIDEAYSNIISSIEQIFKNPINKQSLRYTPKLDPLLDEKARQTDQMEHPMTSLTLIKDGRSFELIERNKEAGKDGPRGEKVRTIVLSDDRNSMHPEKQTLILTTPTQSGEGIVSNTEGLLYSTKLDENMNPVTTQIPVSDLEQIKIFIQALKQQ